MDGGARERSLTCTIMSALLSAPVTTTEIRWPNSSIQKPEAITGFTISSMYRQEGTT